MNLARFFQRLALYRASRRVPLWVLVALSVGFYLLAGIGKAHAGKIASEGTRDYYTSQGEAYAGCEASMAQAQAEKPTWSHFTCYYSLGQRIYKTFAGAMGYYEGQYHCEAAQTSAHAKYTCGSTAQGLSTRAVQFWWPENVDCADPTHTFDPATNTCTAPGPTSQECEAKPPLGEVSVTNATGNAESCQAGCYYAPDRETDPNGLHTGFTFNGTTWTYVAKGWMPTGDTCPVASSDPDAESLPQRQKCYDIEGTSTCLRTDGKLCHEATTGRYICWAPGETGTRVDGPVAQVRHPGTTPGPAPTPPPGETLSPPSTPVTTTTRSGPGGTAATTTVNNYTTINGTNAGGAGTPGTGEPNDGSDAGDDEEGQGTASGGDTCGSPPVVSDALFSKVSEMLWRLRCAGETGDGELDPTVAGAQGDDPHPAIDTIFSTSDLATQVGQGGNDAGIAGMTRTCPALDWPELTLWGETVAAPWPALCDVFAIIAAMVLLGGHIQWAFIVGRIGTS